MSAGKIIVIGASVLLVVGVCIGLIVSMSRGNDENDTDDTLSESSKSVRAICDPTDYKRACLKSMGKVVNNQNATAKDYIKAAITATIDAINDAKNKTRVVLAKKDDPYHKMAKEDCDHLLESAVEELQASYSTVGDAEIHTMKDREAELKNWLSAVISYQDTCVDGIIDTDTKDEVSNGLLNATQLTSNVLAIVSSVSDIIKAFNITSTVPRNNSNSRSRRLLENEGNRKYPSWMSAADRKLIGSNAVNVKPNVVVAQDGSGQFKTITEAVGSYPKNFEGRYVIYVKKGVYNEYIMVDKTQTNIFMYGDGSRVTRVIGKKNFAIDQITTFRTASFAVEGYGFIAKSMGFHNSAGPEGHQAVALRVQADNSAFYNCRMDAYQDTLYVQAHRQFFRNCVISGTVDFIFGDSAVVIQNTLIILRLPMKGQQNTMTAHGRTDKRESTGLVIQNCRIVPDKKLTSVMKDYPSYLGRPWKQYSRTIIMESLIGNVIVPAGWLEWDGDLYLDTIDYVEYGNRGPGAPTSNRVQWNGYHVITNKNEVVQYTVGAFIQGNTWLRETGIPFFLGLKN